MLWPTCLLSAYEPTKAGWRDETGVPEEQGDAGPHRYPPVIPREAEKLQLAACASPTAPLDAAIAWGKWQERRDGQGIRARGWGKALPGPAQGQPTQHSPGAWLSRQELSPG